MRRTLLAAATLCALAARGPAQDVDPYDRIVAEQEALRARQMSRIAEAERRTRSPLGETRVPRPSAPPPAWPLWAGLAGAGGLLLLLFRNRRD